MAERTKGTKTALLLIPQQIGSGNAIMKSLHIEKNGTTINYNTVLLDASELRKSYANLPKATRDVFEWFSKEGMLQVDQVIKQKFNSQRAGMDYEMYYKKALLSQLHQLFDRMKPFASLVKWYHQTKSSTGNIKVAPGSFSTFKPQLNFEITKENEGLSLQIKIILNNTTYSSTAFTRYQFLLECNNEYFLLGFKDYQTLEWLEQNPPAQYAHNASLLAEHVLTKLEEDYTVVRNGLFEQTAITTPPVNRIMLSEISNSFLVLTPQWMYDNFIVEGIWKESVEVNAAGKAYVINRDKEAEAAFVDTIKSLHPNFPKQSNGYYYLSFADAQKKQWFLKAYHQLLQMDVEMIGMDMLQHFRYSSHPVTTEMSVKEGDKNMVKVTMSVAFGKENIPLHELQKILWAGQRAVLLKDGSLGILGDEWIQQYGMLLKHGKVSKQEVSIAKWMALSEENNPVEMQVLKPVVKNEWWQQWKAWHESDDILYNVPSLVQATLRSYQQKGYEWMQLLSEAGASVCLADDMGLGKTLQTICFMVKQLELQPEMKQVIVCPASLIYNWLQEWQKFAPGVTCIAYHGNNRNFEQVEHADNKVIITSYGTMRSDVEKLSAIQFNVVVVDESHNIKNPTALITRSVNQLQSNARVALSGTPVMNNTFDLYAQLNFLLPGMFGSREFFKKEYADAIDRWQDAEKVKALQKLTAPFILRRTKEQVAQDLPPKTEMVMWCSMGAEQRNQYEEILGKVKSSVFLDIKANGFAKSKLSLLSAITRLRQVCNSPLLLPQEDRVGSEAIKINMLVDELANNLHDHKVLVFSQFSSMLNLIAEACTKAGIAYYHFDGSTPTAQRMEMVNNFQEEGNKVNVFLISLMAGNAGLNLTAADYVFLVDPWWNKAVEQQAIDRTHRIGQQKNVFAYKMVCKDTIEEKIMLLQQRKKKLAEDLIGQEDGFVKALSEEDIDYLFS